MQASEGRREAEALLMEGGRPIKRVNRKALYTNLEARINYLQDFMDFNSNDIEALIAGAKYIKALAPTLATAVYEKILERDITARALITQSTASNEPLEEYFSKFSPQVQRRKMFVRWYLVKLCTDPSSMDFWKYLSKVGMMHAGQERLYPLNIEYIHIGAMLGYIQDLVTEAILSIPSLPMQRKMALLRAFNKVIWIQNDLFARWRVRDGEEYADEMSEFSEIVHNEDKESHAESSSISGNSTSGSMSEDDQASIASSVTPSVTPSTTSKASAASVCPFADFAKPVSHTKIWAGRGR